MGIVMINGSPNKTGNTMALANSLLSTQKYNTIHLVDYKVYAYGQKFADDQFDEILKEMKTANTIVIGSPVYWHNMSGAVRNMLDRFYGPVRSGELRGKKLFFLFQGAAPEKWMLEAGEYTMKRFASLYGLTYMGMATNTSEAKKLSESDFES